jgi:hypothetical protein
MLLLSSGLSHKNLINHMTAELIVQLTYRDNHCIPSYHRVWYLAIVSMNIKQLLNGPRLPYESVVYTIFDLEYSEVHVISRDVNSKYGIVKNQLQDPDGMTRFEERF